MKAIFPQPAGRNVNFATNGEALIEGNSRTFFQTGSGRSPRAVALFSTATYYILLTAYSHPISIHRSFSDFPQISQILKPQISAKMSAVPPNQ